LGREKEEEGEEEEEEEFGSGTDGRTDGLSRAECERRTLVGGRKVYENGMGGVGDEVEG